MPAVYYDHSYPPDYSSGSTMEQQNQNQPKEEDTEKAASLLLLLGRSVTPEPQLDDSDHTPHSSTRRAPYQSYTSSYGSAGYAYESPYRDQQQRGAEYEHHERSPGMSALTSPHHHFEASRLNEATPSSQTVSSASSAASTATSPANIDYEALIEGSELVFMKDRDLVPDSLFVAMAQMKPCTLTHADRVGCYKSREIGFLGMCCKHCGGQPGFGRYYPNSVRSLAQTTTSQTILKHVGNKCRFCPPAVRNAVLQLQQQSNLCEGMSSGRPRYGSRKIFFQRVWTRLHKGEQLKDEDKPIPDDDADSTQTPTDVDESSTASSEHEEPAAAAATPAKRKNRFGSLPLSKNKRAKATVASGRSSAV